MRLSEDAGFAVLRETRANVEVLPNLVRRLCFHQTNPFHLYIIVPPMIRFLLRRQLTECRFRSPAEVRRSREIINLLPEGVLRTGIGIVQDGLRTTSSS